MMLRKLRKDSWPVAASLVAHFLVIGLALGSVSFEAPRMPNTVRVTIVGNISDDPVNSLVKPLISGADESSHAKLTPLDHKSFKKPDTHTSTINKIEQPGRDPIVREASDDIRAQTEAIEQTEPAGRPEEAQTDFKQSDLVADQTREEAEATRDSGSETGSEETGAIFKEAENITGPGGPEKMKLFFQEVKNRLEKAKQYPWLARLHHQEGTVRLQFTINSLGEAKNIYLIESSRWRLLDSEAVAVIKRVSHFPQPPGNTDVELVIPLIFRLNVQESSQ
jgi:protein TonB